MNIIYISLIHDKKLEISLNLTNKLIYPYPLPKGVCFHITYPYPLEAEIPPTLYASIGDIIFYGKREVPVRLYRDLNI